MSDQLKQHHALKDVRRSTLTVILGALAIIYGGAAFMKLTSDPEMAARLKEMNFGDAWRYFIGGTEVIGVAGLFAPRLRRLSLICLWPYAIAGLALHISYGHERLYPGIIASLLIPLCLWLDEGLVFRRDRPVQPRADSDIDVDH